MTKRGAETIDEPPPPPKLVLPRDHPLSMVLANECGSLSNDTEWMLATGVRSMHVISEGLVEAVLYPPNLLGATTENYGARTSGWPFRVGGAGVGDDPQTAAMLGAPPRSLVAARFQCPIGMTGVDDAGFVDGSFWSVGLDCGDGTDKKVDNDGSEPLSVSLRSIIERAVAWLVGGHCRQSGGGVEPNANAVLVAAGPSPTHPYARPLGRGNGHEGDNGNGDDPGGEAELGEREAAWVALTTAWDKSAAHTGAKCSVAAKYAAAANGLHAHAFLLGDDAKVKPEWLTPAFRPLLRAVRAGDQTAVHRAASDLVLAAPPSRSAIEQVGPANAGVFTFDVFELAFCKLVTDEVEAYEKSGLPTRRPNTMNNSGLIVNEIGMWGLMSDVLNCLLAPLAAVLYPHELFHDSLDHHHSFVVHYASGKDTSLDMHHDASEVTMNVCLGYPPFDGAGLRFCGRFGDGDHRGGPSFTLKHKPGRGVLHLGRQRHGADVITAGERMNLIVWARSSAFRAAAAYGHCNPDGWPRAPEDGEPERECLSEANDQDYGEWVQKFAEHEGQEVGVGTAGEGKSRRQVKF